MVVVLAASLVLTAMVLYTVFVLRSAQLQILTGEKSLSHNTDNGRSMIAACAVTGGFVVFCV